MLLTVAIIFVFSITAFKSTIHVLGLWLVLLVTHGIFVHFFGETAIHLPMYAGVISAAVILMKRDWKGVEPVILWLFGLLLFVMVLSSLQGINMTRSISVLMQYTKVFMLAVLIIGCVRNEKDIQIMTVYCVAGLIVGALFAIYQYFTGEYSVSNIYVQRAAGLRADPNDTAMLLLSGVPLSIYWLFQIKMKVIKLIPVVSIILLLIGIVLTGSRGGFVALALIFFAIYLRKPTINTTIIGVLALILAVMLAPDSYKERIGSLVTGQEKHGGRSLESRSKLLYQGVTIFLQHPILGVGPGNFGTAYMKSLNTEGFSSNSGLSIASNTNLAAHNLYLEFLVENGIVGGVLLLSIFIISLVKLIKYDRKIRHYQNSAYTMSYCLLLALLGMYFAGLFLSQGKNSVLWFIIGMGLSITNFKNLDKNVDNQENKNSSNIINNELMPRLRNKL